MCQGFQSRFQIHPNLCQIPLFRNYFKLIEQLVSHLNLLHIHLKLIQSLTIPKLIIINSNTKFNEKLTHSTTLQKTNRFSFKSNVNI